jgi:hypothetical protein
VHNSQRVKIYSADDSGNSGGGVTSGKGLLAHGDCPQRPKVVQGITLRGMCVKEAKYQG